MSAPVFDFEASIMDVGTQLARSHEISIKIALILHKRLESAFKEFSQRAGKAAEGYGNGQDAFANSLALFNPWSSLSYVTDSVQRSILFWDTLRVRGNNFIEHSWRGLEPVLHFDYETVLDGRTFDQPVNYAMLRIKPPEGVTVDSNKRPYLIIDPRAGHGPGIGGFKDDSQVGVALRAGHPVYFVIFFPDPEPGQTMLDVCAAEQRFVRKTRELHPASPKTAIIGNCQGGWAAMMLAASTPDDTGPIVINGAPMSYWSGSWGEGEEDNPMRYSGGMLGGTWLASCISDLSNGKFDGAWLVYNFENLNPANSFWDKYYNVYANVDTEPPRFLEFERWWGGYFLMNREEIEWITHNLFIGNTLWSGDVKSGGGKALDLRDIKSPIIMFASMGDNITPPQQAFNWVTDIYGSTEEIKERGQVIVGLTHKSVGHLGIFVSGKVAKKEHAQIVSVLKTIESLPPGLYGMTINEHKSSNGKIDYDVEFREFRLEEISAHFNRFDRADEKPFEAVAAISDFNQRAYEMFAQPLLQMISNEYTARISREFHPLRFQRWAVSDINPLLMWLAPSAQYIKSNRHAVDENDPLRHAEKVGSEMISASLDCYRAVRDAATEASFFSVYANIFSMYMADKKKAQASTTSGMAVEPRELPFVMEAMASIAKGGYAEAFARVAFLLSRKGEPLPLSRLEGRAELASMYSEYLPSVPAEQLRRIRGVQEIIARYEPEQALATLPALLADNSDRERLLTLLDKVVADERVQNAKPTQEQLLMLERIRTVLEKRPVHVPARTPARGNARSKRRHASVMRS